MSFHSKTLFWKLPGVYVHNWRRQLLWTKLMIFLLISPQALAQCRGLITVMKSSTVPFYDTAGAAKVGGTNNLIYWLEQYVDLFGLLFGFSNSPNGEPTRRHWIVLYQIKPTFQIISVRNWMWMNVQWLPAGEQLKSMVLRSSRKTFKMYVSIPQDSSYWVSTTDLTHHYYCRPVKE